MMKHCRRNFPLAVVAIGTDQQQLIGVADAGQQRRVRAVVRAGQTVDVLVRLPVPDGLNQWSQHEPNHLFSTQNRVVDAVASRIGTFDDLLIAHIRHIDGAFDDEWQAASAACDIDLFDLHGRLILRRWPVPRESQRAFVNEMFPAKVFGRQSVPEKVASMRLVSACPLLPNVPRHPRGDANSP